MCQALKRILLLGGFEPRMYGSAEALLDDDRKDAVCMILDVQLPGMSGFALRERLGAHAALPPVIFVTAFDDHERASMPGRWTRDSSPSLCRPPAAGDDSPGDRLPHDPGRRARAVAGVKRVRRSFAGSSTARSKFSCDCRIGGAQWQ
jgi:CheY-like chemotaxis protein